MAGYNDMREYLASEYGITNDKELLRAIKDMPKLNIGIFVSQVKNETLEVNSGTTRTLQNSRRLETASV